MTAAGALCGRVTPPRAYEHPQRPAVLPVPYVEALLAFATPTLSCHSILQSLGVLYPCQQPSFSLASTGPRRVVHAQTHSRAGELVLGAWGRTGADGGPSGRSPRHPERWDPGTAQTQAENVFFFTVRVVYHQHPTEAVDPHPCSTAPAAGAVPLLPAGLAPAVPTSDPVLSN